MVAASAASATSERARHPVSDRGISALAASHGRSRALWLGILLASALASGCASLGGADGSGPRARDAARPEASAEYDVLVGSLAAQEGRAAEARAAFERAAQKDPDSAYLQRALGRLSAQLDDLEQALVHAERAVELDPEDPQSRLFLGRLYRIQRNVAGAEEVLRLEDGQPIAPEAALLLYQVYLEANRLDDALRVAQDLVAEDPESLSGHMAVATVYERMGRLPEAESALRQALKHHPGRFVLYSRLARMRRSAGDRKGEIEVYREVLREHPQHYGTLVSLGEAQVAVDDLDGAIATYDTIVRHYPDDQQSIRRLASLEYVAGHHAEAAERLEAALARNPGAHELAYALGQVWRGAGESERARVAFERVPESDESYPDARLQIAEILEEQENYPAALIEVERVRAIRPGRALDFHTAALRWRAGNFEGGLALLDSLLEENPKDDEVLYQIGVLYGMAKRVDDSLRYMQLALDQNPENANALNYVGYTWAERGENLDEAERLILQALQLRPDDGYITDSLGWVYYMRARPLVGQGRREDAKVLLERAREHLFQAAELTGGDPVVSEHLGDVHLLLDEKQRALDYYEEALGLGPRADEQPNLMDKLEGLRRELSGP